MRRVGPVSLLCLAAGMAAADPANPNQTLTVDDVLAADAWARTSAASLIPPA